MEWAGAEVLIAAVISLTGLSLVVILLFTIFQNKKNYLIIQQAEATKNFEREVKELQIEIREQTLRNISWELHDNIGQLITLAKIQAQNLQTESAEKKEISDTLGKALSSVRALSKVINPDVIESMTLPEAVQLEAERMNRMGNIEAEFIITGEQQKLDSKTEIVLFRIIQEFISNTLKHAKATKISIELNYNADYLEIIAKDNGKGFNQTNETNQGIGLINMKKRAGMIHSELSLNSQEGIGTTMTIIHNQKKS
jgi:two-component system, NarL family, sensor kinase